MSKEFAIDKYLVGALYKAKLDAENKEFEYARNGMRIPVELSRDEIAILLDAILDYLGKGAK